MKFSNLFLCSAIAHIVVGTDTKTASVNSTISESDDGGYETVFVTRMVYQDVHVYVDESGVPVTTKTVETTVTGEDDAMYTSFYSSSAITHPDTPTVYVSGSTASSSSHHH